MPYEKIQSSKFCQATPLKIYITALTISNDIPVTTFEYPCSMAITDYIQKTNNSTTKLLIFNYTMVLDNYRIIKEIQETINCLECQQNLTIIGYPLLTQFTVGILYFLAHTFQTIELQTTVDMGCIIILKNYTAMEIILNYLNLILMATEKAINNQQIIVSVVPVAALCGKILL